MANEPQAVEDDEIDDFILIEIIGNRVEINTTLDRLEAIDELLDAVDMLQSDVEFEDVPEARLS